MDYVIIGNGPAGVIAAETLRKADPAGTIKLIGDEPAPPYSRMAIPYLLMGNIGEAGTYLRKGPDHFQKQKIDLVSGRVNRVDTEGKKVFLADGSQLPYERLLIASGCSPIAPPIPGVDLPGVHNCWTLEDARAIANFAKKGSKVIQMGAGFIGCIILEALASRGVDLTVVEMGNRMVPRMMTETAGDLIKKWCEKEGVKVFTSTKVNAIEQGAKGGLRVKLDNGQTLDADLVISATGVRPNIAWLKDSGIVCDVGIRVDDTMQSNVAGVYAAGDVAQTGEFYTGNFIINAIQPNAADQAQVAALNMAGKGARSQGTFTMNVLDTLGLISASFGQWMGVSGGDHVELVDGERFRYLRLEFKDDVLVGATSLGLTEDVGVIRGLIQGGIRLGKWKDHLRQDPTRFKEAYLARTQGTNEHYAKAVRHA
jgi:NAD(P)H-nitrite reductase large subunit